MSDVVMNIGQVRALIKDFSEDRAAELALLAGVPRVGETINNRRWSANVVQVAWYVQPYEYDVFITIARTASVESEN